MGNKSSLKRKNQEMLVSIIVPIYKTEKFLDKCLSSIVSQTYENIEIICVDDCSPDNSWEVVERFAKQDDRVSLIKHEVNLGLGGARNTAIKVARGEYIASVDSDDSIKENMIETLVNASEGGRFDVVVCGFDRVGSTGEFISKQAPKARVEYNENNDISIFKTTNPAFWNKLWRRTLYTDNNIYFPNYVYYQDLATTPRILTKAKSVKLIEDSLYNYLVRDDSATFTSSEKHIIDYFKVFSVLRDHLIENGLLDIYEEELRESLDNAMRYHSNNVKNSIKDETRLHEYFKYMLFLKWAFWEYSSSVKSLSNNLLQELLIESSSKFEAPSESRTLLDLSLLVKTFQRPDMLERFLLSAGRYQEVHQCRFFEVIVADDSDSENKGLNRTAISNAVSRYPDLNVKYCEYDFNVGLSYARNTMVDETDTEYFLLCDDDFILDEECDLQEALTIAKNTGVDLLGGWLKNNYNLDTGAYSYWGAVGRFSECDEGLTVYLNETEENTEEFEPTDFLLNFYIGKKSSIANVRWKESLKIEEHYEFFYRFFHSDYNAALSKHLFVKHTNEKPHNPKSYNKHRFDKASWEPYLYNSVREMGKKWRTVNRWRSDHFISWQTDCVENTNVQKRISLHEGIIGQKVPVSRITPQYKNYFFGYYDVRDTSSDDRYVLCQSAPAHDRLQRSTDVAKLLAIDTLEGQDIEIGETTAWCFQQGAQLQFHAGSDESVIFNVYDAEKEKYSSKTVNIVTKKERNHPLPIAALSPDGKYGLSLNFSRLYDYRPGYGYSQLEDPYFDEMAPNDDGIRLLNFKTNRHKLIVSLRQLKELCISDKYPEYENSKVVVNHVAFNTDSTKIMMLFRVFSETAPFPTFTLTCNVDGSDLKEIFAFTSHYHWRDDKTLLLSGASEVYSRKSLNGISLYELDTETGQYEVIEPDVFNYDGHCSYSPDRSMIMYDSYPSKEFPYKKLHVYDLATGKNMIVGYFYSEPNLYGNNSDCRCDLHPRWSIDGSSVTFDSNHEGYRGVYKVSIDELKLAYERDLSEHDEQDLRIWYKAKYLAQKEPLKKPGIAPGKSSLSKSSSSDEEAEGMLHSVEMAILGRHLEDRKRRKLKRNRRAFFLDSKSKVLRAYGGLIK